MSGCGCTGEFHNGGCSDVNVIFWQGAYGKIPVSPTPEQIADQMSANYARAIAESRWVEAKEILAAKILNEAFSDAV